MASASRGLAELCTMPFPSASNRCPYCGGDPAPRRTSCPGCGAPSHRPVEDVGLIEMSNAGLAREYIAGFVEGSDGR
jgi:predicted amidophosphoribosyltransferase